MINLKHENYFFKKIISHFYSSALDFQINTFIFIFDKHLIINLVYI
jgi:hypothetical protein